MLNAVYHSHFQTLLHEYLAPTAFPSYLHAYFAHSMSIHRIKDADAAAHPDSSEGNIAGPSTAASATASTSKPPKTGLEAHVQLLVRLGFLPRYAHLLVQVACAEIEAIVKGASAAAIEAGETAGLGDPSSSRQKKEAEADAAEAAGMSGQEDAVMHEDEPDGAGAGSSPEASGAADVTAETEPPEDDDPGPWGTRRLEGLRAVMKSRVTVWLWTYVDGACPASGLRRSGLTAGSTQGYEALFQPKNGIESRLDVKLLNDFFEMRWVGFWCARL